MTGVSKSRMQFRGAQQGVSSGCGLDVPLVVWISSWPADNRVFARAVLFATAINQPKITRSVMAAELSTVPWTGLDRHAGPLIFSAKLTAALSR